jgi:hypothetical protein
MHNYAWAVCIAMKAKICRRETLENFFINDLHKSKEEVNEEKFITNWIILMLEKLGLAIDEDLKMVNILEELEIMGVNLFMITKDFNVDIKAINNSMPNITKLKNENLEVEELLKLMSFIPQVVCKNVLGVKVFNPSNQNIYDVVIRTGSFNGRVIISGF